MKNLFYIPVIISVILLSGCSKDEPGSGVPLISTINIFTTGSDPEYLTLKYDKQNRLADYTYEDKKIYSKGTELHPNGAPKKEKIFYLDNSGKVTQIFETTLSYHFLTTVMYDASNRVTEYITNRRELDSNGDTKTGYVFNISQQIEWDSNNNVKKISTTPLILDWEFSEYTTIKNTLSAKNIGFDFFGPFPELGLLISVYGDNPLIFNGSTYLPGKSIMKYYYRCTDLLIILTKTI